MPDAAAEKIADQLARQRTRLVLVESCTGGLAASRLATVPGISQWWCGSLVVYREASKSQWLGVPASLIAEHTDVGPEVTAELARRALERTTEAEIAAAITGHLGPNAPAGRDGEAHTAVLRRGGLIDDRAHWLVSTTREDRLSEAARLLLAHVLDVLEANADSQR